jgi:hypothetical protein
MASGLRSIRSRWIWLERSLEYHYIEEQTFQGRI